MKMTELLALTSPGTYSLTGRDGIYRRIYPSGQRSWVWRYKWRGETKWHTLPPQITGEKALKAEVARLRGLVDRGIDPKVGEAPKVKMPTVQEVFEEFVEGHLAPKRSEAYRAGVVALWQRHAAAIASQTPLDRMSTAVAAKMTDGLLKGGKATTYNYLRAVLSKLCNWARGRYPEVLRDQANWKASLDRLEVEPDERVLTLAEVAKFGEGWKASRSKHKHTVMLLLLTGSRAGMAMALKPEWLEGPYLIAPSKREAGLKKATHLVCSPEALACLHRIAPGTTASGLRHGLDSICQKAGLDNIHPHTLRKTFSSLGVDWGEDPAAINALLNHKGSNLDQRYLRRSLDALYPAALRVSAQLMETMGLTLADLET